MSRANPPKAAPKPALGGQEHASCSKRPPFGTRRCTLRSVTLTQAHFGWQTVMENDTLPLLTQGHDHAQAIDFPVADISKGSEDVRREPAAGLSAARHHRQTPSRTGRDQRRDAGLDRARLAGRPDGQFPAGPRRSRHDLSHGRATAGGAGASDAAGKKREYHDGAREHAERRAVRRQ